MTFNPSNNEINLQNLNDKIKQCRICEHSLPEGCNPIVQIHSDAKILIAGQAPGKIVHETNIPFNDQSGNRLRQWMGIEKNIFYDPTKIAILPMGFCFPGSGKSGDLAPRKECAKEWRQPVLDRLPNIKLTLLIGLFAMKWHLGKEMKGNLTNTVKYYSNTKGTSIPLPHPSPRNYGWMKKNPWFEKTIVPTLQEKIKNSL